MNRKEAEDFVYKSYLKASKFQDYNEKDSNKRHPEYTYEQIEKINDTPAVVVTGSKGKGSVSCMISQILQTNYSVGLMTSPHMINFCERFKINNQDITDDEFVDIVCRLEPIISDIDSKIPPNQYISPMGIQTMIALTYFNNNHTDINVFECGKGVKYDDVNNISHSISVINTIFLEHTRELGETLVDIAKDKSHIIKEGQKVVFSAEQDNDVIEIIRRVANEKGVELREYGKDFWTENIRYSTKGTTFDIVIDDIRVENVTIPLLGEYQARNCAMAMAVCNELLGEIDYAKIKASLLKLSWPGRLEIISNSPLIILDACINKASCDGIKNILDYLSIKKANIIIGIPDDKDYVGVAKAMLDKSQRIILTKSQNPHYVFTRKQIDVLRNNGIESILIESIDEAIHDAISDGIPTIILGTTSVVSEVKKWQLYHA